MADLAYLRLAIQHSERSAEDGNFPAGGVVVRNDDVLATAISSPYPGLLHADSKAVKAAFEAHGRLDGATLYVTMQCCLMCTGVAYWAGIRRIVYAVPKSAVSGDYYETPVDTADIVSGFNEKIDFVHMAELQADALAVVQAWEKRNPM